MKRIIGILVFSTLIFSSCHIVGGEKIRGNGTIKAESRITGSFSRIDVSGNIDLYIKQDSSSSVKIETDENLMEYIEISTDGNTLRIKPKDNASLKGTKGVKIYISNPVYTHFEVSGACDVVAENKISSEETISVDISGASEVNLQLKAPKVDAELTGASNLSVNGETKDLSIDCAGASKAKCFDLLAENADVDISGASKAEVFASVKIDAKASGASHISYKGNASIVGKSASGASSVEKAEAP